MDNCAQLSALSSGSPITTTVGLVLLTHQSVPTTHMASYEEGCAAAALGIFLTMTNSSEVAREGTLARSFKSPSFLHFLIALSERSITMSMDAKLGKKMRICLTDLRLGSIAVKEIGGDACEMMPKRTKYRKKFVGTNDRGDSIASIGCASYDV